MKYLFEMVFRLLQIVQHVDGFAVGFIAADDGQPFTRNVIGDG